MQNRNSDTINGKSVANDSEADVKSARAEDVKFTLSAADREDIEALERAELADQRQE